MLRGSLRSALPLVALAALIIAAPAEASPASVGPPSRVTALGDSITRGYNSQGAGCVAFVDCPANSWATGTNGGVNSYLARVKALNPSAVPSNAARGNDAVTGAKAAGLAGPTGQAATAVAGNPDLVLIEIGANDVCTSSEATMTSVSSFTASITDAMNRLTTGLPNSRIMVSSIPNIFNLWNVLKGNATARFIWGAGSVCQSMLASPASTSAADVTRRANVQARNVAFNSVLQSVCAQYIHCRYDGGAAYAINFVASDVGTIDYFHPATGGQAKAAAAAWTAGPNYTDLTAPTTTIARDRPADGVDDWYRNDVQVSIAASDPSSAVSGSEFYYKLQGDVDKPWTKYTGSFTISTEGATDVVARSVDVNGNIGASQTTTIKIDKTPPAFSVSCPSSSTVLGDPASATVSGAGDAPSGFAADPNGTRPVDTSRPGNGQLNEVELQDLAGNTTTHSCTYDVRYPDPGAPALSTGVSPNADGVFTLGWTGADPSAFGIRYALQHRDADDAQWSDVAGGIASLSQAFTGGGEGEGTWSYRVQGSDSDLGLTTAFSDASTPVKVDESAPAAPTVSPDRAPDYSGGGGWYRDTVTGTFTDNGDPALQDGSAGSGVDPASIPGPVVKSTSGAHTVSGTVADMVGNASPAATLAVQVDATDPTIGFTSCPAAVLLHATASNVFAAADADSGLASPASGTSAIDTSAVGPQTTSRTAADNVGRTASASCTTAVDYLYSALQQPVNPDGSSIFKLGSTVPLKFRLTDAGSATVPGAVAVIDVAKVTDTVEGTYVEAVSTSAATTGNLFRESGGQYIFNLATKGLSAGTWSLRVKLDDGRTYTTRISLR